MDKTKIMLIVFFTCILMALFLVIAAIIAYEHAVNPSERPGMMVLLGGLALVPTFWAFCIGYELTQGDNYV